MHKVECVDINISTDKYYACVASSNNIVAFEFRSNINNLSWIEYRCLNNKECREIRYRALNNNLPYPRMFANLPFGINEIENIYEALDIFKLQFGDIYKFAFRDDNIIKKHLMTKLYFHKHIKAMCGHQPTLLIIKAKEHAYFKSNGKYTIQCNEHFGKEKWFNINRFTL